MDDAASGPVRIFVKKYCEFHWEVFRIHFQDERGYTSLTFSEKKKTAINAALSQFKVDSITSSRSIRF